jgi:16S rRNA C967 or C1407 C5-methylase (RsmB/RsmF family)/NOL1/NOP2/fmu family ribosome biogenesis protein
MKTSRPALVSTDAILAALGSLPLPDEEVAAFCQALTRRHPSALRLRRHVDVELPFATEAIPWYRLGQRTIDAQVSPSRLLSYATADYYLQDAGSMLALAACDADGDALAARDGLLFCDLCAAPGGKASGLLEAIGDNGFLLANEPIRSRIAPLSYNLARTGSDRFAISSIDPDQLADRLSGVFDVVLVDAPCSGQALLSRGRQTASALSQRQIAHSAARQRRILIAATRLLRDGGRLIYSTCTFTEEENEQQVAYLINQGLARCYPVDRLAPYQSPAGWPACYRLWPHRHRCAGSFAASLETAAVDGQHAGKRSWRRQRGDKPPTAIERWFDVDAETSRLKLLDAVVFAWPEDAPAWIDELATAGPEILHRTGQTWKPAHAAALRRVDRFACRQSIEVDAATAKTFLSGQSIASDCEGWQVVRYRQQPLGWIKASQGTGKNHLPAAARMIGPWLC